jgi:Putative abortive phage resistance protein AbiGi, antitoxin
VCFCDIPVQDLEIHMKKYSRFGLSFEKRFLISRFGASPVFYIAETARVRGTPFLVSSIKTQRELFDTLGPWLQSTLQSYIEQVETQHPATPIEPERYGKPPTVRVENGQRIIDNTGNAVRLSAELSDALLMTNWVNERLFSYLKFFDPSLPEDDVKNTYMEREWRVLGDVQFSLSDIERIIVPRPYARRLKDDFPSYYGQVTLL